MAGDAAGGDDGVSGRRTSEQPSRYSEELFDDVSWCVFVAGRRPLAALGGIRIPPPWGVTRRSRRTHRLDAEPGAARESEQAVSPSR